MLTLRTYQREALDTTYEYWRNGGDNPLIVCPCGGGKSLMIAQLCYEAITSWPGTRILVLAHRKELLLQNGAELQGLWPGAPIGYYSAGMGRKENTPILFAGVQSIHARITDFDPFDLVIIDEAHLIPRSIGTMYGACLANLKLMDPQTKFVGLTATPYRLDSGLLCEGEGALFDRVVYDIAVQRLVDAGHLVEVHAKGGRAEADLRGVHHRGGEFVAGELEAAFDRDELVEAACDEIVARGADRRAWLVFASGVRHAEHVRDALRRRGVDAECVIGECARSERDELCRRFKAGELKCLVNVDILTTGANFPRADLLALLRATESTGLYVQVVGRVMRTFPGKTDGLLLDFGGNVLRHGPIDRVNLRRPKGQGTGEAPAKKCPVCESLVATATRECPDCGYLWPPPKPRHEARAYEGAVLARQQVVQWVPVTGVRYARHQKAGRPDSVRVTYGLGLNSVSDWWCPEHEGRAAETAWAKAKAAGATSRPRTVSELLAVAPSLRVPEAVIVRQDGEYTRVERVRYSSC